MIDGYLASVDGADPTAVTTAVLGALNAPLLLTSTEDLLREILAGTRRHGFLPGGPRR